MSILSEEEVEEAEVQPMQVIEDFKKIRNLEKERYQNKQYSDQLENIKTKYP